MFQNNDDLVDTACPRCGRMGNAQAIITIGAYHSFTTASDCNCGVSYSIVYKYDDDIDVFFREVIVEDDDDDDPE